MTSWKKYSLNISPLNPVVIYHGIRGTPFKQFISNLLKLGNLKENTINTLLDDTKFKLYEQAFTHKTAHSDFNYECLEFLGDVTLNKSIAWYLSRRFPQLVCPSGVKILTRLKINLISKKSFASFAKGLKFWDFISCDIETRETKMDKTLEDVFESFFGATEILIDQTWGKNIGYNTCYTIIETLMNTITISLHYNDLFDSITRLKELFDQHKDKLGRVKYESERNEEDGKHYVKVYSTLNGTDSFLNAVGEGYLKADAKQRASEDAIKFLEQQGYTRTLSVDYQKLCV